MKMAGTPKSKTLSKKDKKKNNYLDSESVDIISKILENTIYS